MRERQQVQLDARRAPQGARGLKFLLFTQLAILLYRRAPQGARGLKLVLMVLTLPLLGRAPQGARGLKSFRKNTPARRVVVAPRKGRVG